MNEVPVEPTSEPSGGFFSRRRNQVIVGCGALLLACVGLVIVGAIISVVIDDDADPTATSAAAEPLPATEDDRNAEEPTAAPTNTTEPGEPTNTPAPTATDAPLPTSTLAATNTPSPTNPPAETATPESEDLQVRDFGFGQETDSTVVGWGVLIENPDSARAIESSEYQIAFLDENDVVIETDSGFIGLLWPGQRFGIAGEAFLDEGVRVSSMQVQVLTGDAVDVPVSPIEVEQTIFYSDDFSSEVAGIVINPTNMIATNIRLFTITYDESGQIIGGGSTYLDVLPASGRAVGSNFVEFAGTVATVEMFATFSGISDFIEVNPETDLQVVKFGFGTDSDFGRIGWAATVNNPNVDMAVVGSEYYASFYDGDGRPVTDDWGYLDFMFPGSSTAVGSDLVFIPEGVVVTSMEIVILTDEIVTTDRTEQFAVDSLAYVEESFSNKVTAIVGNPYDEDFETLDTVAVAYDEDGKISGGGSGFLDFLLALGQSAAEVDVVVSQTPATVEMYVNPSSLTDFE